MNIARTLKEADEVWTDGKYDLLVLDVSLPDGSGFEFCKKVRLTSKVPIIFLTASDEETSIIMGLDIGGDDYITKPFKLGVLVSRINALLRRANSFQVVETELQSNGIKVLLLHGQSALCILIDKIRLWSRRYRRSMRILTSNGFIVAVFPRIRRASGLVCHWQRQLSKRMAVWLKWKVNWKSGQVLL